jgi:uncharacterized membrane protein
MGEDDAAGASEQVSDWIACTAGSGPVLVLHVIWFGTWVTVNTRGLHGILPLDPFPFPFLTMTVSRTRPINAVISTYRSIYSPSAR